MNRVLYKRSWHCSFDRAISNSYFEKVLLIIFRSNRPEVFLGKGVLKLCSKFTGEYPCWSAISLNLLCNFIEIVLRYGCSPVNLLHIFRIPFLKNTSERLLLKVEEWSSKSRCYKIWHSKKYAVNLDQKKKRKILRNYEDTREKSKRRRLEDLDDLVFK